MIQEIPWKRLEMVCNRLNAYSFLYNANGAILEVKADVNRISRDILDHIEETLDFRWYYIYPNEGKIMFSDRVKLNQTTFEEITN